jgi:hypothetical protein
LLLIGISKNCYYLKVEIENVCDVDVSRREAHVFAEEVGQSKVSIGGVAFRQEN